jgi:hypothetical protein
MGLNKLAESALLIVLIAAAAGQLPRLIQTVRVAQLQLIKDSQSSKWGQAFLLRKKPSVTRLSRSPPRDR